MRFLSLVLCFACCVRVVDAQQQIAFNTKLTIGPGMSPNNFDLVLQDLNDDNWLDVVTTNRGFEADVRLQVGLQQEDGGGNFQTPDLYPVSGAFSTAKAVATGDFNGDGSIDLAYVVLLGNESIAYRPNTGNGTFGELVEVWNSDTPMQGPSTTLTTVEAWDIQAGDMNGDNSLDLIVSVRQTVNLSPALIAYFEGNGQGGFNLTSIIKELTGAATLALGDFNGDEKTDVALLSEEGNSLLIFVNQLGTDNNGTDFLEVVIDNSTNSNLAIVADDIDGDGVMDIICQGYNSVTLYHGLAGNNLEFDVMILDERQAGIDPNVQDVCIKVFDVNGDDKKDIVFLNRANAILLQQMTSNPLTFVDMGQLNPVDTNSQLAQFTFGDIDNDGIADLVSGTISSPNDVIALLGEMVPTDAPSMAPSEAPSPRPTLSPTGGPTLSAARGRSKITAAAIAFFLFVFSWS